MSKNTDPVAIAEFSRLAGELQHRNPVRFAKFMREMEVHVRVHAIVKVLARHPEMLESWLLDGEDRIEQLKAKRAGKKVRS